MLLLLLLREFILRLTGYDIGLSGSLKIQRGFRESALFLGSHLLYSDTHPDDNNNNNSTINDNNRSNRSREGLSLAQLRKRTEDRMMELGVWGLGRVDDAFFDQMLELFQRYTSAEPPKQLD